MTDYLLQHDLCRTAERQPDRIALRFANETVTYGELLRDSVNISDALIGMGMETAELAAICLDKSPSAICAMFGVLFAAGSYIPLDAYYSPVHRLLSILSQSRARFLITDSRQLNRLLREADEAGRRILISLRVLLTDKGEVEAEDGLPVMERFTAGLPARYLHRDGGRRQAIGEDLAYILYTSGSTGTPKGVMISHLNARTFVDWCIGYFQPDSGDKFAAVAPFHFDLSVFDIFVPLAVGAELVVLPAEQVWNPALFAAAVKREGITYVYSVPSLWNAVVQYARLSPGELSSVRKVLTAGEVLQPGHVKAAMELMPQARFYNLYGLIETNVCTYYPVTEKDIRQGGSVPIGYACGNTEVVAVTAEGTVAGIGGEGELCVRGSIVMKGYYGNPTLTAERWIPHPSPAYAGEKLFATGDLAVLNENGAFVLIGRKDSLVKRAGFRIELPEMERVLHQLDGVEEAAVVDIKDAEGGVLICAAVAVSEGAGLGVMGIKQAVGRLLPNYMIPDLVHLFDRLPKGASDKVDRQSLKAFFLSRL